MSTKKLLPVTIMPITCAENVIVDAIFEMNPSHVEAEYISIGNSIRGEEPHLSGMSNGSFATYSDARSSQDVLLIRPRGA
jgi:hypothetical protein